jgi:hypothetical protein
MELTITLRPIVDVEGEQPPAMLQTTFPPGMLPNVGDMLMLDSVAWTCVHRIWHMESTGPRVELFLDRAPDYTAWARRWEMRPV